LAKPRPNYYSTLVALTLMLAESNPDDTAMLVKVVVKLMM
jgi:hypothetical protein